MTSGFPEPPGVQLRTEDSTTQAKWTLGGILAFVIACLLCVLAFSNLTEEGTAKRSLVRSLAILTEVDAFLDVEYEPLRERAGATEGRLALADWPVPVLFTSAEVLESDRDSFRDLLLTRSAERLYDDGAAVLLEGREGDAGLISTEGLLRRGIDILRPAPHRVAFGMAIGLAVLAAALAAALASVTRGYGRLIAIGISVFVASAPVLAFAVAVRFAFRVGADGADEYVSHEFLQLGQELAWALIRNGMIFAAGAALAVLSGALLTRTGDARNI